MQKSCLKKKNERKALISTLRIWKFKNYHPSSSYTSAELPGQNKTDYVRQIRGGSKTLGEIGYFCRQQRFLILKPRTRKPNLSSPVWTFHHRGRDGSYKTVGINE